MFSSNKSYTIIQNNVLHKNQLPLKVIGLYCLIASLPATWTFSLRGLAAINSDGITSIRSAISALEKESLLEKFMLRDQSGKMLRTKYHLIYPSTENNTFTRVPNQIFRDKSISLRAKGLFCLISSLPQEHWRFSALGLTTRCKDGKDAIFRALKELEDKHYLIRLRARDSSGKYNKSIYKLTLTLEQSKQQSQHLCESIAQTAPKKHNVKTIKTFTDNHTHPTTNFPNADLPSTDFETLCNNKRSIKKKIKTNPSRQEKESTCWAIQSKVRSIIEYHVLLERYASDEELIHVIVNLITETYLSKQKSFILNCCSYAKSDVISRLETLDFEQVESVLLALKKRTSETTIRNLKSYLFTCLFNAATEYQRTLIAI